MENEQINQLKTRISTLEWDINLVSNKEMRLKKMGELKNAREALSCLI